MIKFKKDFYDGNADGFTPSGGGSTSTLINLNAGDFVKCRVVPSIDCSTLMEQRHNFGMVLIGRI